MKNKKEIMALIEEYGDIRAELGNALNQGGMFERGEIEHAKMLADELLKKIESELNPS